MAFKIDRSALRSARESGAIPAKPKTSFGSFGTTDEKYKLLRFTAYRGQNLLLYIPNFKSEFLVDDKTELPEVDMDMYSTHTLHIGNKPDIGENIRCVRGFELPEFGLEGTCPICDLSFNYTSFIRDNLITSNPAYQSALAQANGDTENKDVKKAAGEVYRRHNKVERGQIRYTVPVALVETTTKKVGAANLLVPVVEEVQNEDGTTSRQPKVSYWFLDMTEGQYNKLVTGYRQGFDEADADLPEDASQLYNSWVRVIVPDEEDNMKLGKELSFARYAKPERKATKEDANSWGKLEQLINKKMTDDQFDSTTAMTVLTRNKIYSMDEISEKIAPLATDFETLKVQLTKAGSMEALESQNTEDALDSLLGEESTQSGDDIFA